jgi:rhamnose utilization protein RhaD (predicted bifunctional aldolase and dehydrogenase)
VILGGHGLINWADDDKACYELTLDLIERAVRYIEARDKGERTFGGATHRALGDDERRRVFARLLPWLRGQVSSSKRFVATVQDDPKMPSPAAPDAAMPPWARAPTTSSAPRSASSSIGTRPRRPRCASRPDRTRAGVYADYAAYMTRTASGLPAMRDPNRQCPCAGLGMIAWGRTRASRA